MSDYQPNFIERFSTWAMGRRPAINESVEIGERKFQALRGRGLREFTHNFKSTEEYSNKLKRSETRSWFRWYDTDSTVRSGINTLSETAVGLGYHTIMPSSFPDPGETADGEPIIPKEKELVDEFGRVQNLDHLMNNITRLMLIGGFCPVETAITKFPEKSRLKIIHPVTVEEIHVDEYGQFDYLIQRINTTKTEKFTSDDVTMFVYNKMGNSYRGRSLVETVVNELSIKHAALNNMEGMIERYISPLYIWQSTGDITPIKNALESRDSGEDMFLGNMELNEFEQFKAQPIEVQGDAKFKEFITFVDQLIWIGINSANQMYWRNATEASATVLEAMVDRNINAIQRNVARGMEDGFFKRVLIENGYDPDKENNVPRVGWGTPKTGTEDLRPEEVIMRGLDLFYIREAEFWQIMDQMGFKVKPKRRLDDSADDVDDDATKGDPATVEPEEEPTDDSDDDTDT